MQHNRRGIAKIDDLVDRWVEYHDAFNRSFEGESSIGGMTSVKRPEIKIEDLEAKFPRAPAYRKAVAMSNKSNYEMSKIGLRAVERILNEDDYEKVITDMEKDLDEYLARHEFD